MSEATAPVEPAPVTAPEQPAAEVKKPRRPSQRKKAAPEAPAKPEPKLHPFFRDFETREIHRSLIQGAPYNPRDIDRDAKTRLDNGLRAFGMREPLIWNEESGNLVGGHQRLGLMDQYYGHTDYLVVVSVVHLAPTKEKELNLLLNSSDAQGRWDGEAFAKIFADTKDINVELAGFDKNLLKVDLDALAAEFNSNNFNFDHIYGDQGKDSAKTDATQIRKLKEGTTGYKEVAQVAAEDGMYLTLVFHARSEKEKMCAAMGISAEAKDVAARQVAVRLGIDIGFEPEPEPNMSQQGRQEDEE